MATAEERLMQWLRDAHAAEEQAETVLTGMAGPAAKLSKAKGTHQETYYRDQAPGAARARLHQEAGGQNVDHQGDTGGKLLATGQALSGMFVGDEGDERLACLLCV
jgi:ferritin-like metal-binding protein YciE